MFKRSEARACAAVLLLIVLPSSAASCLDETGGGATTTSGTTGGSGGQTSTSTGGAITTSGTTGGSGGQTSTSTGGAITISGTTGGSGGQTSTSTGGATTTSGTTGGSGGQTSTSTGGATTTSGTCVDASKDCPGNLPECQVWNCDPTMNCAAAQVQNGTPAGLQTAGDCKKNVCIQGAPVPVDDNTDVVDDGTLCTLDACIGGTTLHLPMAMGTTCSDSGGAVCDAVGQCLGCIANADCKDASAPVCDAATQVCVPLMCADGMQGGDETDVDCGGSCGKCDDGLTCLGAIDCKSRFCDDGTVCAACVADDQCAEAAYCSAGVCTPQSPPGEPCSEDIQCASGHCVEGVCCDSACDQPCQQCSVAGACENVPFGVPDYFPENACVPDIDGVLGYSCDGAGNCLKRNGDTCADSAECLNGHCAPDGICCETACDAPCERCYFWGVCTTVPNGSTDDIPAGACTGDHLCENGTCKKALGLPCSSNSECYGSHCVDGFCCGNWNCATEPCMACNVPGYEGECSSIPAGEAPIRPCPIWPWGPQVCNGDGGCVTLNYYGCIHNTDCLSFNCYHDPTDPSTVGICLP